MVNYLGPYNYDRLRPFMAPGPYARGGLDEDLSRRVAETIERMGVPMGTRVIESGYRSEADQANAIRNVARQAGLPFHMGLLSSGIRGLAAPVGRSKHQHGAAVDIASPYIGAFARNADPGLRQPLPGSDPGHFELGSGSGTRMPTQQGPQQMASMPQLPMMPQPPQPQEQDGFSGYLQRLTANPLFLMGASVLGGQNIGQGIMGGIQASNAMQRQRQMDQRQAQQDAMAAQLFPYKMQALQRQASGVEPRPWWAGPDGAVDPAMAAKTLMGRPQTNIANNMPPQEKEFDKEIGKELAKEMAASSKAAFMATQSLGALKQMEAAASNPAVYTGTGGPLVANLKKAAQTLFNVPIEGVADAEVITKLTNELAVNNRSKLPGPMSNADRDFLVSMAPNLSDSPQAMQAMLKIGMLSKQYEIDRARAAMEYAKKNGGRLDVGYYQSLGSIDEQYGQAMSELVGAIRQMAPAPRRSPAAGINEQIKKRWNLD